MDMWGRTWMGPMWNRTWMGPNCRAPPRPVARSVRPAGLQPAAPPPDVERPAREEAGSGLEVCFPSLLTSVVFSAFPCFDAILGHVCGVDGLLPLPRCAVNFTLGRTDGGRKFMDVADPWVCAPCLNSLFPFEIDGKGGVHRGTFLRRISVCV
jgi:hypothetical protein